jgi:ribosomal protein S27E
MKHICDIDVNCVKAEHCSQAIEVTLAEEQIGLEHKYTRFFGDKCVPEHEDKKELDSEEFLIKLKPCPFCGGEAALYANDGVVVRCQKCSASTKIKCDALGINGYVTSHAIEDVVKAWNRRV